MTRTVPPAEATTDMFTFVVDPREQTPWPVGPCKVEVATLRTGDYSVKHLEHYITVERKSLSDFVACCGAERERFEHELRRMLAFPARCVIIEADLADLELGNWRGQIKPPSVTGSLLGWMEWGIPFLLAGNHDNAAKYASRFLFLSARRRYRELRGLLGGALETTEATT